MAFHCEIVRNDDTLTLRLAGRLTLGPQLLAFGPPGLRTAGHWAPAESCSIWPPSMKSTAPAWGNSSCSITAASQHHCPLCLVRLTPRIERMLETTKLDGILPHFNDPLAARSWVAKAT